MKGLIFTGAFGMGHYSAAQDVKEEILKDKPETTVIIIDMIEYIFPKLSKLIYDCFNFMVDKFSLIYNCFNKIVAKTTSVPLKKSVTKKSLLYKSVESDNIVISGIPIIQKFKEEKIIGKIKDKKEVLVIGYTDKVDQYMKKADLIISKYGGIILFDAIFSFSETPLYVIGPFLYQEIGFVKNT